MKLPFHVLVDNIKKDPILVKVKTFTLEYDKI
jgi:hypothetical protein